MSDTVIRVENLSKEYRLGVIGTGTLSHDLNRWVAKVRGKEDPALRVTDIGKGSGNEMHKALDDISFDVKRGEVLGIIGKNGAGKSTLLKILSRVTTPTSGTYKVKGRIASLLEVGTGFHPDLSGRENVFLNGAILGMTKPEIRSKLDEIIDFSGVEKFVDTPVKRYSSGMYVRLAFAVAAHLEPEILIVDEVLAVGDIEFQRKCIGKMKNVAGEGRTVLFVSHNMAAVKSLCNTGLLLVNGRIKKTGNISSIVDDYLALDSDAIDNGIISKEFKRQFNSGEAFFTSVQLVNEESVVSDKLMFKQKLKLKITIDVIKEITDAIFAFSIKNSDQQQILYVEYPENNSEVLELGVGEHKLLLDLEEGMLPGKYAVCPMIFHSNGHGIDILEKVFDFEVGGASLEGIHNYRWNSSHGYIYGNIKNIKIEKQ